MMSSYLLLVALLLDGRHPDGELVDLLLRLPEQQEVLMALVRGLQKSLKR